MRTRAVLRRNPFPRRALGSCYFTTCDGGTGLILTCEVMALGPPFFSPTLYSLFRVCVLREREIRGSESESAG